MMNLSRALSFVKKNPLEVIVSAVAVVVIVFLLLDGRIEAARSSEVVYRDPAPVISAISDNPFVESVNFVGRDDSSLATPGVEEMTVVAKPGLDRDQMIQVVMDVFGANQYDPSPRTITVVSSPDLLSRNQDDLGKVPLTKDELAVSAASKQLRFSFSNKNNMVLSILADVEADLRAGAYLVDVNEFDYRAFYSALRFHDADDVVETLANLTSRSYPPGRAWYSSMYKVVVGSAADFGATQMGQSAAQTVLLTLASLPAQMPTPSASPSPSSDPNRPDSTATPQPQQPSWYDDYAQALIDAIRKGCPLKEPIGEVYDRESKSVSLTGFSQLDQCAR